MTNTRNTRTSRSLAAAVLCTLVLAACGGEDASEADTGAATPPEDAPAEVDPPEEDATADAAEEPEPADARVALLDDDGFAFSPAEITVEAGETVTWVHEGRISHTVTAEDDSFASGTLATDDTFEVTFDEPGSYPYVCDFHGNMRGIVTVS